MSIYQLIYTSSKRGYGIFSQSPEIRPDESRQITITTTYKRPQDLINTNEENLNKYPINLSRFKLTNQKWVLSQSKYIGLDNTGRQGNFFTHALLFPNPSEINRYLYFQFRDRLTDEEKEQSNPSPLGSIAEPTLQSNTVKEFAKSNSSKVPMVIQAFLDAQRGRKKLVITDTNERTILWIKLLFEVLPDPLVSEIEFTTYSDRITSAFDIVGVYDVSIIRDPSRVVQFNGKDYASSVSSISKSLANDYINDENKVEFNFFSSFIKPSELLQNIASLYETLDATDVDVDDIFDLIRSLPMNDKQVSDRVLSFLLSGKYLKKFSSNQIDYLLRFLVPSEKSDPFNEFLYTLCNVASKEVLDVIVKNVKYDSSLMKYLESQEKNVSTKYLLLNLHIKKNHGRFNKQEYTHILDLALDIANTKKDWLEFPLTHSLDQLIEYFPYDSYKTEHEIITESDLIDVVNKLSQLLKRELIINRLVSYVKKAFQNTTSSEFALSLRNVALISAILKEMKEVNRFLRTFDSREQAKQVEYIFYQLYIGLTNSRLSEELLRTSYKELFPTFQALFDMKQRMGQRKLLRTYSDLVQYANNGRGRSSSNLSLRANYLLYAIVGITMILSISATILIGYLNSPTMTLDSGNNELTVIRSVYFSKSIKPDDLPLIAFENTPDSIIQTIANDIRSEYILDSGFSFSPVEIDRNNNRIRAKYNIIGAGLFTSPSFHVDFELIELEDPQPPSILIDGVKTSGSIQLSGFTVKDTYNKSVSEILLNQIGEISIEDPTITKYMENQKYQELFEEDFSIPITGFSNLNGSHSFIDYRIDGIELIESNKNIIDVTPYEITLVARNHLGLETTLTVEFKPTQTRDLSRFNLSPFMYYEDFSSGVFALFSYDDLAQITNDFLNDQGLFLLDPGLYEYELDLERSELSFVRLDDLSTIPFTLPVVSFVDNEKPELTFVNPNVATDQVDSITIVHDWLALFGDDFDQLIFEVLEKVGNVIVTDDSLTSLDENQFFQGLVGEYTNEQSLNSFDHPIIGFSRINKDRSIETFNPETGQLTFNISVYDKSGISSRLYRITVLQPSDEPVEESTQTD